jgi:hypothetical protein
LASPILRVRTSNLRLRSCKNELSNSRKNSISLARSGVLYAPRSVVRGGMQWSWDGICKW